MKLRSTGKIGFKNTVSFKTKLKDLKGSTLLPGTEEGDLIVHKEEKHYEKGNFLGGFLKSCTEFLHAKIK